MKNIHSWKHILLTILLYQLPFIFQLDTIEKESLSRDFAVQMKI